ncbi:helix-turn-helix domain-containing protein [Sutterella sp.]|uniref:helix-turn-helix domain-containing protein n=1 Tax=Sutterella sp. TaxID=1981025 RepID=UPI0026E08EEE|nr:helix-turn-helix domain-containing protein [Sutterella sp.]MDO5532532.1 helix-turn-helix domain-containing protein [Sutterella sp.]
MGARLPITGKNQIISREGRYFSEDEIAELIELRWKGLSPREAAREFGTTEQSVVRHWERVTGKRLGEKYSVLTADQTSELIVLIRSGYAPEKSAEILGITITHLGAALKSDPEIAAAVTEDGLPAWRVAPAWRDLMDAAVPVWTTKHYLSDKEIKRLVAMRRAGKSLKETASALGVSERTVSRIMRNAALETVRPRTILSDDLRKQIVAMSDAGSCPEVISRRLGVAERTVRRILKKALKAGPVPEPGLPDRDGAPPAGPLATPPAAPPAAGFIRRISEYMTWSGLDAETLGTRIGVAGDRLSAWLAGTASPSREEAAKLEMFVKRSIRSGRPSVPRCGTAPGTFEERLRKLMVRDGLSVPGLARRIGVSDACVRNWLKARTRPSGKSLRLLAEVFNAAEDWLLYGDDLKRRFPRRNIPWKRDV